MIDSALEVFAATLACIVFATASYRSFLALSYFRFRAPELAREKSRCLRFATIIPAHNEALVVGASIDSIHWAYADAQDCRVYVVADNCSDSTADVAYHHGARVLVRDASERGKGWALEWAVQQFDLGAYDAIAFVDADNLVDAEFFREMSRALLRGKRVVQGYDGIANPLETPLTRLITITSLMKNLFYNAGKSAVGLSPHLMGTGMVFAVDALRRHGWRAHSIVEGIEQSLHLIMAGERIWYVAEARVYAQEAATFKQARSQRQRWASGQAALARLALRAIGRGISTRRWTLIDAGADLLLPFRYSRLLYCNLFALLACWACRQDSLWPLGLAVGGALLQVCELAAAVWLLPHRRAALGSLVIAPAFIAWKAWIDILALVGHRRADWVRTRRHVALDSEFSGLK